MFILKLLLKLEGTKGVDTFLHNNNDYLYSLKAEKIKKFFKLYLSTPFDSSKKYCFEIFEYIKHRPVADDEMLTNAIYFKTMPDENVIDALKKFHLIESYNYTKFVESLIKRIKINDKNRIEEIPRYIITENDEAMCNKLVEFKDVDLIISLINKNLINPRYLSDKLIENFTIDEVKRVALNFNHVYSMEDIILDLYFKSNYSDILDLILKFKELNKENENVFNSFAVMFQSFFDITEEFEQSIIDTDNKELMYAWIVNTKGNLKEDIIEKLMIDKIYLVKMLLHLNKRYVLTIIDKIRENKEIYNIEEIVNDLCNSANIENIEKIDYLISCFSSYNIDVNLSKENSVLLISLNSRFSQELIRKSDFNELERKNILESLNKTNKTDLLTIYGSYLISGDKSKLLEELQIRNFAAPLRKIRKNNN